MERKIEYRIVDVVKAEKNMLQEEQGSFWYVLGYKYLGALVRRLEEGADVVSKEAIRNAYPCETEKGNYLIQELLILYFELWEKGDFEGEYFKIRTGIEEEIKEGVQKFIERDIPFAELSQYADAVEEYLRNEMTPKELIKIQELPVVHNKDNKKMIYPLTRTGEYTMGIVNPWPGDKSAEAEVLSRMKVGAEDAGLGYVMLDNFGHILDGETQKATEEYVNPEDLQFVITTHYESEKTVDAFYYHTLWNPPEIPLNLEDYDTRITNNYLMNDDYLIYDFGGMSNHLKGILLNKPRTIEGASALTASFPKSRMLEPKLEDPKLFYCGMNWEKVVSNSNRHEGLFKLLDETGKVKFFGPDKVEAWGGLRPWEGYKCYQHSIPFDGFSILDEINQCGICLVLSSDIHRRAGAATNRTYEACAAGAVIISDDNEFMQHYFKDAALFIEYNKNNPTDTFEQIMEKYQWIVSHKEEALEMARRAQQIFVENFSVDNQMLKIINNHYSRFCTIEGDLFADDESKKVLVTYVINTIDVDEAKKNCLKVIKNIKNQYYENIMLGVACDQRIEDDVATFVRQYITKAVVVSMQLYDHKGSKQYTDGQAIRVLQNNIKHDYWVNILAHEVWYYDHITTLVKTIQEENAECVYAGRLHKDKLGYARVDFFDNIHLSTVFGMSWPDWLPVPGQMLFRAECDSEVPEFMMECLDGYEHYAYLGMIWIKNNRRIAFTKRTTSCWCAEDMDERNGVLKAEYQIRYIRDILRFDLPDGGLGGNEAGKHEAMKQYMMEMPVKPWFKARWYNMLLKYHTKAGSKRAKKIEEKYKNEYDKFMSW